MDGSQPFSPELFCWFVYPFSPSSARRFGMAPTKAHEPTSAIHCVDLACWFGLHELVCSHIGPVDVCVRSSVLVMYVMVWERFFTDAEAVSACSVRETKSGILKICDVLSCSCCNNSPSPPSSRTRQLCNVALRMRRFEKQRHCWCQFHGYLEC